MKITLLIGSLTGGGAERVVCNLANYLVNKGHKVTILTVSDQKTYEIDSKVKHVVLYGESSSKLPLSIMNVIRLYRMNKYFRESDEDAYVTFLPKTSMFILAQRRFIRCPIILAERCDPSKINRKLFEKYYQMADAYVFQTENAKKYYTEHGIDVSNSIVIPNAIKEFMHHAYEGKRKKVIVGIGRLTKQKNFPLLINAFNRVHEKFPDYKLEICGKGPLESELQKLTRELNIESFVSFPGYIKNILDHIQDASLFVLSSDFEGMPNALMEAMMLGLPCISTDCPVGGPKYLIKHETNGLLIPIGDEERMEEAMLRILSNPQLAADLGKNASKISERLSPEKIYGQWEQMIFDVIKNK